MKDAVAVLRKDNHMVVGLLPELRQLREQTHMASHVHGSRYAVANANISRVNTTGIRIARSVVCGGWLRSHFWAYCFWFDGKRQPAYRQGRQNADKGSV